MNKKIVVAISFVMLVLLSTIGATAENIDAIKERDNIDTVEILGEQLYEDIITIEPKKFDIPLGDEDKIPEPAGQGDPKRVYTPPWNLYEYEKEKSKEGVSDSWQEGTKVEGTYGKSHLYSWAGPGWGIADITVWLMHGFTFTPPVTGTYYFTFKYKITGETKLDSGFVLVGISRGIGKVDLQFRVDDEWKTMTVFEKHSVCGTMQGFYPFDITKTVSNDAQLTGGEKIVIQANSALFARSEGVLAGGAIADIWTEGNHARLVEVTIDWTNHPPNYPSNPSPGNGATSVSTSTNLGWDCSDADKDPLTYDVYFGTSNSPPKVKTGHTQSSYDPGSLNYNTKYYWKVVAKDNDGGSTTGPTWSFTTKDDSCCFPAGTKISMAGGGTKNIEDVKVGDRVLSYEPKLGEFKSWTVKMLGRPVHPICEINNGLISATVDHPFYVKKSDGTIGWGAIDAERAKKATSYKGDLLELEVGDQLFTADKEWIEVTSIKSSYETVQTYNLLSFSGTKTYFANGILVYEEHPPQCITTYLFELIGEKYPQFEQIIQSSQFFNKILRFLP